MNEAADTDVEWKDWKPIPSCIIGVDVGACLFVRPVGGEYLKHVRLEGVKHRLKANKTKWKDFGAKWTVRENRSASTN